MAASEPPGALVEAPLDELRPADLDDALALTAEAGWNQLAADWELMTRAGRAWAIRRDGRAVATALALPYPPGFGWISMVLVHGPERRRGHATRLVERAVEHLEALGLVPLLDATPAGAEVYGRMGFRPVDAITRWRGPGGAATGATQAAPITLEPVRALDRAAFGADRGAILDDLVARPGAVGHVAPDGDGLLLSRAGRTATQLGPLVARDADVALRLMRAGLDALAGTVVVDVPDRATAVRDELEARGFAPERPYIRMARGRDDGFGEAALVHAIAGPELG